MNEFISVYSFAKNNSKQFVRKYPNAFSLMLLWRLQFCRFFRFSVDWQGVLHRRLFCKRMTPNQIAMEMCWLQFWVCIRFEWRMDVCVWILIDWSVRLEWMQFLVANRVHPCRTPHSCSFFTRSAFRKTEVGSSIVFFLCFLIILFSWATKFIHVIWWNWCALLAMIGAHCACVYEQSMGLFPFVRHMKTYNVLFPIYVNWFVTMAAIFDFVTAKNTIQIWKCDRCCKFIGAML